MTKATLSLALGFGALLVLGGMAFANDDYPPAKYDVGTRSMSERAIQDAGNKRAGVRLNYYRVEIGRAAAMCDRLWAKRDGASFATEGENLMACQIEDEIVYSYDTPSRARLKGRKYHADYANRLLRHEIGHRLGWKHTHPWGVSFSR